MRLRQLANSHFPEKDQEDLFATAERFFYTRVRCHLFSMSEFSRRHSDQLLSALPSQQVNEGIAQRLLQVEAGQRFQLRAGTDHLLFDEIRQTTWGEVMQSLVQIGVLQPSESGTDLEATDMVEELRIMAQSPQGALRALTQLLNS